MRFRRASAFCFSVIIVLTGFPFPRELLVGITVKAEYIDDGK
jgi:hypothetical protein